MFNLNAKSIALVAVLSAIGASLRYFTAIPLIPGFVELTPSFIIPILAGTWMGMRGGISVGFLVGLSGAFRGGEFPLIPLLGNVMLGIGPGLVRDVAVHEGLDLNKLNLKFALAYMFASAIIGGFAPTFMVSLMFMPLSYAAYIAIPDAFSAFIAAIVAVMLLKCMYKCVKTYLVLEKSF